MLDPATTLLTRGVRTDTVDAKAIRFLQLAQFPLPYFPVVVIWMPRIAALSPIISGYRGIWHPIELVQQP